MTKEAEHAIDVEKLTKRYGNLLAVNDISFTVRKGEVFAFLGQTQNTEPNRRFQVGSCMQEPT
jgi:ABC-type sugar transport system ATPase subunit